MSKVDLVATRKRMVHAPAIVLTMVLSLSACVDLTPPWEKKAQTSDAQAVGGKPDTGAAGGGGAGGSDAGNNSSAGGAPWTRA
jgi:hypothetical protein